MPSTVNGIGTHYYGRRNRDNRAGTCTNCGQRTELKSFDTWHCACFVYIPLFPIGRRRIIDSCPVCTAHVMMPLDQWNDLIQLALPAAFERYGSEVNLQTASDAHSALLGVRNTEAAKSFRAEAIAAMPNHEASLKSIFGWQLLDFREHKLAKKFFNQAIELDPDNHAARAGVTLYELSDGKIDRALERMEFLTEKGSGGDPYFHLLEPLISACVEHRRFEDALKLSNHVLSETPEAGHADAFRKRHKMLQKRCGVKNNNLPTPSRALLSPTSASTSSGWKRFVVYGSVVSLLLLIALAMANGYAKRHRTVHVVCGETANLQLIIDNQSPISLSQGITEVVLAEGQHSAALRNVDHGTQIETQFEISSSFPKRLFSPRVLVFNATGMHMVWTVHYARNPRPTRFQAYGSFGLKSHDNIDYLFEEPPDKLNIQGKKNGVVKYALTGIPVATDSVAGVLQREIGYVAAFEMTRRYVPIIPDNDAIPETFRRLAERTDRLPKAIESLRPYVQTFPPKLKWHRAYIGLVENAETETELVEQYEAWLKNSSNDRDTQLLRSTFDATVDERISRLRALETTYPDDLNVRAEIAGTLTLAGDFDEAHEMFLKLVETDDSSLEFHDLLLAHYCRCRVTGLEASVAHYREELDRLRRDSTSAAFFSPANLFLLDCYVTNDDEDAAKALMSAIDRQVQEEPALRQSARIFRYYYRQMSGDLSHTMDLSFGARDRATERLQDALADESDEKLLTVAESPESRKWLSPFSLFALSAGLRMHGHTELADQWLETSAEAHQRQRFNGESDARVLVSKQAPRIEVIDQLPWKPHLKALLLADLATRFPRMANSYRQRAEHYRVSSISWGRLARRALTPQE